MKYLIVAAASLLAGAAGAQTAEPAQTGQQGVTEVDTADDMFFKVWGSAADDVYVVGERGAILHWNGAAWSRVSSDADTRLVTVHGRGPQDVWAVGGYYDDTADLWETLTLRWNGSSWRRVLSPSPGTYSNALSGVDAVGPNDVWAVGTWTSGDGVRTLALH